MKPSLTTFHGSSGQVKQRFPCVWQVGWIILLVILTGCVSLPHPDGPLAIWPAPPQKARIVLRKIVRQQDDIAVHRGFAGLGRLIFGRHAQRLLRPQGVAVDSGGRLIVADQELQGVHVFDTRSSRSLFIARADSTYLVSPVGVAACGAFIAVSDSALNHVYLFDHRGRYIRTIDKPEGFMRPTGLAYDENANVLYVVDTLANEVCAFRLTGELLRRFGEPGTGNGQFNYPTQAAVDADGTIYITDSMNFRVQVFDRDGGYLFQLGRLGDASGYLAVPKGVAVDHFGHIYIVDSYLSSVQVFNHEGAFLIGFGDVGDQPGQFQVPTGLAIDADNRIYVCDSHNRRIQVFQYVGGPNDDENE